MRAVVLALLAVQASAITLQILANGEISGETNVTLPDDSTLTGDRLADLLAGSLPWPQRGPQPFFVSERSEVFATNRNNLNARRMLEALQDGDKLYVVPAHRQFVRSVPELGKPVATTVNGPNGKPILMTALSVKPRLFHVSNVVSEKEMDALVASAHKGGIRRSTVGFSKEQTEGVHSPDPQKTAAQTSTRTSENAWVMTTPEAKAVKERVMNLLSIQTERGSYDQRLGDGLQVLRYRTTQAYNTHYDYFTGGGGGDPNFNLDTYRNGSNRFVTMFIYMSDPTHGGQTTFQHGDQRDPELQNKMLEPLHGTPNSTELNTLLATNLRKDSWEARLSKQCFTSGISVYPRKGDAVLFYSQTPDGHLDKSSMHAGCPVLEGEKWAANLWVWNKPRMGEENKAPEATKMNIRFYVTDPSVKAQVYWRPVGGELHPIVALGKDGGQMEFTTQTFDTHRFEVYVQAHETDEKDTHGNGKVGQVVARVGDGKSQAWHISAHDFVRTKKAEPKAAPGIMGSLRKLVGMGDEDDL